MKNTLSMRSAFALIIIMQTSKILISGFPRGAGTSTWISVLLSGAVIIPLMLIYARLIHLMPGKSLFEMAERIMGRPVCIAVCALYAYFFLTTSSIMRGNYSEFMHLTSLYKTSFTLICLTFFILCGYLAFSGAETMGKWSVIATLFAALSFGALLLFSFSSMRPDNLVFALEGSWADIGGVSLRLAAMPFGEAVLLLALAGGLDRRVNPYKLLIGAGVASFIISLLIYFHSVAVLGQRNVDASFFPSYKAANVINIGSIGTRLEALIAFAFIVGGITKASIGLLAGTKAVAYIFKIKNHWDLIFPIGLLTVAMTVAGFYNLTEWFEYIDNVFPYYAPVFQAGFPFLLWVAAEIRLRKREARPQPEWRIAL